MGVKNLWTIIDEARVEIALSDLQGMCVAVDLGFWVTQMQTAVGSGVMRPHLRNLFFRIWALLQKGIRLIFVADGKPPQLKVETMKQRQDTRNEREGGKHAKSSGTNRNRFLRDLNECCELIELIGLPCIKADGEAEALCAALNRDGLVDAVISDDSDAFLYGSDKVLRGFNLESAKPSIQMYSLQNVQERLALTRHDLVALSVLLGCDYIPKGVPGIGKEMAMGFIHCLKRHNLDPLVRLEDICKSINAETHHLKTYSKEECAVVKKILAMPEPINYDDISAEFLLERLVPISVMQRGFEWRAPKYSLLMPFLQTKLDWKEEYCVAKIVPFLTLWTLINGKENMLIEPIQIVKARVKQGVACFEVQWKKLLWDKISEEQCYVTLETCVLMENAFPELVETFKKSNPVKKRSKSKKVLKVHEKNAKDDTNSDENRGKEIKTKLKAEIPVVDILDDSFVEVEIVNDDNIVMPGPSNSENMTVDALCNSLKVNIHVKDDDCKEFKAEFGRNSSPLLPLWERIKVRTGKTSDMSQKLD